MIYCILLLAILTQCSSYFTGIKLKNIKTNKLCELDKEIIKKSHLNILSTYAADFNAIEYAQKLCFHWPELKSDCNIKSAFLPISRLPSESDRPKAFAPLMVAM